MGSSQKQDEVWPDRSEKQESVSKRSQHQRSYLTLATPETRGGHPVRSTPHGHSPRFWDGDSNASARTQLLDPRRSQPRRPTSSSMSLPLVRNLGIDWTHRRRKVGMPLERSVDLGNEEMER